MCATLVLQSPGYQAYRQLVSTDGEWMVVVDAGWIVDDGWVKR